MEQYGTDCLVPRKWASANKSAQFYLNEEQQESTQKEHKIAIAKHIFAQTKNKNMFWIKSLMPANHSRYVSSIDNVLLP